mgnify:CR=1 FL=1|jgi:ribosome-interacting GTPase 1|tara:strand:+ start:70 stop:345 length:276 start_codon:yes stop_codon:yes gene_type:complete
MTNEHEPIVIENIPLPEMRAREEMRPEIIEAIERLEPTQSFFVATDDEDHTQRRMAALRQRLSRMKKKSDKRFTLHKREENGRQGFRIYRL